MESCSATQDPESQKSFRFAPDSGLWSIHVVYEYNKHFRLWARPHPFSFSFLILNSKDHNLQQELYTAALQHSAATVTEAGSTGQVLSDTFGLHICYIYPTTDGLVRNDDFKVLQLNPNIFSLS